MTRLSTRFRLVFLPLLFTLAASLSPAQTTNVSATITDQGGVNWINAKIQISFIPTPGVSGPSCWQGQCTNSRTTTWNQVSNITANSSGVFTVALPDVSYITPAGSQWSFSISPDASSQAAILRTSILGATQDLSAAITAVAGPLAVQSLPVPRGYTDSSISNPPNEGQIYYNTATHIPKYWDGSVWQLFGGGTVGAIISAPTGSQTITQPLNSSLSLGTSGTGRINQTGFVAQSCTNSSQVALTVYTCNLFQGSTNLSPNIGQQILGMSSLVYDYDYTGPGSNPGTNGAVNNFNETIGTGPSYNVNSYQRGVHAGFETAIYCAGGGDCQGRDTTASAYADAAHGSDEGTAGDRVSVFQINYNAATITSGGTTGAIALSTNSNPAFRDESYVIDQSKPQGTAVITAQTFSAPLNSFTQTVSGITMTPSTAWGTMDPTTATYATTPVGVYQNYTSVTASITLGTSPASPGAFTTGAMTCSGSALEYMAVTAVGAVSAGKQSVTFLSRNGWDSANGNTNNAACFQGGSVAGQGFISTAFITNNPIIYPIIGAISSTVMAYANCVLGVCNFSSQGTISQLELNTPITLFNFAEVIGTNLATPGAVQLATNNVPWTNGDTISNPIAGAGIIGLYHGNLNVATPQYSNYLGYAGSTFGLINPGAYGFQANDIGNNPAVIYYGFYNSFPANNAPLAVFGGQGNYQNGVLFNNPPISGGCIVCTNNNNTEGATFTASLASNVLTVTAISSGSILTSQALLGAGIPANCLIGGYTAGSGTRGGVGTYNTSCSATVGSEAMTTAKGRYRVLGSRGSPGIDLYFNVNTNAALLSVANSGGTLEVNTPTTFDAPVSFLNSIAAGAQNQATANNYGGTCSMAAGTSCTFSISHNYATPVCIATQQGTSTAGGANSCSVSGLVVTVTAAVANSETWGAFVFGNPN